jgi:carbon-monoxide dehydrogenase medium subunit
MKLPAFNYERPASIDQAIALLCQNEDAKIIAGGQTLLPVMAFRLAAPTLLVDICDISELRGIHVTRNALVIGATTRWRDILDDTRLAQEQPLLQAAIHHVAHYQIRNRGTVGGSLAHADPAAEMPGIAAACDAEIVVAGPTGTRSVSAEDFFIGSLTTDLTPSEIIIEVRLPRWTPERRWSFQEFARRKGDFALAAIALHYRKREDGCLDDVHLAAMGIGDRPSRISAAEELLNGKVPGYDLIRAAAAAVEDAADSGDDLHASQDYRKAVAAVLVERAFAEAEGRRP